MVVTRDAFRQAMGLFATGVTVVTSHIEGQLFAMTANAITSVSLDPVLVLVCVDKTAFTHEAIEKTGVFAVSILDQSQEHLSRRFATKPQPGENILEGVDYHLSTLGCPLIDGSLAYLDCRVYAAYPGGDHTIFLGEVQEASVATEGPPLIFYRSRYAALDVLI